MQEEDIEKTRHREYWNKTQEQVKIFQNVTGNRKSRRH